MEVANPSSASPSREPRAPFERRAGSYRLVRLLGTGAMGEVWLGRHSLTGGVAAVKILKQKAGRKKVVRELFVREGLVVARLSHPHIARLFEMGPDYLATAYIEGTSLARRLKSPMSPARAVHIVLQIASALEHAHERGVVHRDVKPSNIPVTPHLRPAPSRHPNSCVLPHACHASATRDTSVPTSPPLVLLRPCRQTQLCFSYLPARCPGRSLTSTHPMVRWSCG